MERSWPIGDGFYVSSGIKFLNFTNITVAFLLKTKNDHSPQEDSTDKERRWKEKGIEKMSEACQKKHF
jgi:hypothetical protein